MPDSTIDFSARAAADTALGAAQSEIETEVVLLFDQFRNRLLRYVLSIGVYPQDGEDIIQEVFLSLFRHLRLGKPRANLRGWIFRVAHNLALKQRSAKGRQYAEWNSRVAHTELDTATNPEEQFSDRERQKKLLAVVHALPERDQWCLYMRAEGLRYREIAEALGMSLGSVSNRLARAMARLASADEG